MNLKSRLSEIRARLSNATPSPWQASDVNSNHREVTSPRAGKYWVADCSCQADCELIAHAPTDLKYLADTVEKMEKVVEAAKELRKEADCGCCCDETGRTIECGLCESIAALDGEGGK